MFSPFDTSIVNADPFSSSLHASSLRLVETEDGEVVLRLPAGLAERAGLEVGEPYTVSIKSGQLVVTPIHTSHWAQLEQLLTGDYQA